MDAAVHTYLHCRSCLGSPPEQPLEVGITPTGLLVNCPRHGRVVLFTPAELAAWITRGPHCEHCSGGPHPPSPPRRPRLRRGVLR